MELRLLDGQQLYKAFIGGAKRLINDKHDLNRINVFPVADGDTGSNMAFLMQTIINEAKPSESVSDTLESIASASLSGSRGNSGIIFSEYLYGLYEHLRGKVTATIHDFSDAFRHASQKAYQAILNPVEGTILTVLRKASETEPTQTDFVTYFEDTLNVAKKALVETTDELAILKASNVVDAGAKGFTDFLEGIHHYFVTGEFEMTDIIHIEEAMEDIHVEDSEERYCTEALIMNSKKTSDELKQLFAQDGSSLIVSGRIDKTRLHIHTNHPDQFFYKLSEYGQIVEQKVDDMHRQLDAVRKAHPEIAILTDSIADVPADLMDKYQIHLLPIGLLVDDVPYLDKVTISSETFYKLLKKADHFSSSQPNQKQIERTLDFLLDHYKEVLVITVSSQMSGTYNAFMQYAKDHPEVKVFDSLQNSGAEGLVVLEAAKLVEAGKNTSEIVEKLNDFTKRTKIFVSVNTLKYMVKQGRVSKVTGIAAKIMNLKPVIGIDENGKGMIARKALSLNGNVRQILELVSKGKVSQYAIVHSEAEERANKLAQKIENITGLKPLYTMSISPVVSMNAGLGTIAVALTYENEVKI
ncbi:MAG: fatty acid-binding protein DegV [Tenericutes bacterium HGW-Tenericutes-1]|jgi:hypothetical protein|nr:MAG: fatty acid-binding protein DegV [Tenericutes bacterium HGW-Tenericutes-3]PKL00912.1 MAG: fatty acid-binding protein DegV [Tenericutes bacterium HGW-Tenericutes-1]